MIYGNDTRVELYELDPRDRLAAERVVAIGSRDSRPVTLGEAWHLCPGQRFAEQPRMADCTGLLIEDDLVLTAAHCVPSAEACRGTDALVGFQLRGPHADATEGVTRVACQELVAVTPQVSVFRVASQHLSTSLVLAPARPRTGDRVLTLGHPGGVPLKADPDARVTGGARFFISADAFAGSSGSPVFDSRRALVGVLLGGESDLEFRGACKVARQLPDAKGREYVLGVQPLMSGLCATNEAELRHFCSLAAKGAFPVLAVTSSLAAVALVLALGLGRWRAARARRRQRPLFIASNSFKKSSTEWRPK